MLEIDIPKLMKWLDTVPIQSKETLEAQRKENELRYKRQQVASLRRRLGQAEKELATIEGIV